MSGAGYGEYTIFALTKTSAKRVIAFEPNPAVWEELRHNLRINGLENDSRIALHLKYLGSAEGPGTIAASRLADWIVPPCLIKLDIDGGEGEVMRASAPKLLSAPGLRWIIETHSAELERECITILEAAGYAITIAPNAWWRAIIPELRPIDHNRWLVAVKPGFPTL